MSNYKIKFIIKNFIIKQDKSGKFIFYSFALSKITYMLWKEWMLYLNRWFYKKVQNLFIFISHYLWQIFELHRTMHKTSLWDHLISSFELFIWQNVNNKRRSLRNLSFINSKILHNFPLTLYIKPLEKEFNYKLSPLWNENFYIKLRDD